MASAHLFTELKPGSSALLLFSDIVLFYHTGVELEKLLFSGLTGPGQQPAPSPAPDGSRAGPQEGAFITGIFAHAKGR